MVNKKLGIEKLGKSTKDTSFLKMPEVVDNLGIIRHTFEGSQFEIGTKVYYGGKREEIRINGKDIQVMDEDNIIAIVKESNE